MARLHCTALSAAPRSTLAVCTLRVRPGQEYIRLIPDGEFHAPRGAMAGAGPWRLTPESAARVIAANRSRAADILIDFEHQTLLSEQNGQRVLAAGWVDPRSLEYRPTGEEPGLYGRVKWVGDTAQLLEADLIRYISPVFPADPQTGEPLDLYHAALTNFPAIDEPISAALSARYCAPTPPEDPQMDLLKKLLVAIGLPDATSEADALAGVAALKAKADAAEAQIAALKAGSAAQPDPAKYVPIETMKGMQDQIVALSARINDDEAARLIEGAIADGKLTEPQRAWAEGLGKKDIAALRAYVSSAPAIAALKGMQTQGKEMGKPAGMTQLTESELAVCKAMGLSADEFIKHKEA